MKEFLNNMSFKLVLNKILDDEIITIRDIYTLLPEMT
jgi:hypothetical protein